MRKKLSLDKNWKFRVYDPEEEKPYKHPVRIDFYSIKTGSADGFAAISYNDSGWDSVDVPHDRLCETEICEADTIFHGGRLREEMWYRKVFAMDEKYKGMSFTLTFGGIACSSVIYFNGAIMKRSFSPYEEIVIDLTDRMHFGKRENVLCVFADAKAYDGWWCEGAGIYRHVDLYIKNPLHIAHNGLFVKPVHNDDDSWTVDTEITVENSGYTDTPCYAVIKLLDADNNAIATEKTDELTCGGDDTITLKHSFDMSDVTLWDIDTPYLYKAEVTLFSGDTKLDTDSANTGFRYFRFDANEGFFLNGRHLILKGAAIHQDHACVGAAIPDSIHNFRVKKLRDVGCNMIRCAHNPFDKPFFDACDRLGMLTINENRHLNTSKENTELLKTMILQSRNHPSVIIYSLFNEEPLEGDIEGRQMYKRLQSIVKKLDDSRVVLGCMHTGWFEEDGAACEMDVIGFNYSPDKQIKYHEMYPDRPTLGTEAGSNLATRGCYKTNEEKHIINSMESERTWHNSLLELWDIIRKNPFVSGFTMWTGIDYRGEAYPFGYPSNASHFGFMDRCCFMKTNGYYVKSCYSDEPMIQIEPHWNHKIGEIIKTKVITNCEETELFLNGVSLGRRTVDVCNPNIWEIEFIEGTLEAKGYINGKEVLSTTRKTAGEPYAIKLIPDRTSIKNDAIDAVVCDVCIVDKDGTVVPDCSALINFEIDGGRILGTGNGDPNSLEIDSEPNRHLYCGYAQTIFIADENTAALTLKATSNGVLCDEISFEIIPAEIPERVRETDNRTLGGWTLSLKDYTEEPDPMFYVAEDDFNTLVPVVINPTHYQLYTNCWKIYRVKIKLHNADGKNQKCTINMSDLLCEQARGYANGRLVFEAPLTQNAPVKICFDTDGESEFDFRLHINARKGSPHSGMRGNITLSIN